MAYIIKDTKIVGKSTSGIKLKLPKGVLRRHLRVIDKVVDDINYKSDDSSEEIPKTIIKEIVNLNTLNEFWVKKIKGNWEIYATPINGTQYVSMNFSDRKKLTINDSGNIYVKTDEDENDNNVKIKKQKAKRKFVKHIARDERLFFLVLLMLKHMSNPTANSTALINEIMGNIDENMLPTAKISDILKKYGLDINKKTKKLWKILNS